MINYKKPKNKLNIKKNIPASITNSQNSNSNGCNNSIGQTQINNSGWMGVQMWFPWYNPPPPKKEEPQSAKTDGLECKGACKEFYQFVEPNQEDGSFICFKCRNGY